MPTPTLPEPRPNLTALLDVALATGGETDRFDFKENLDLRNDEHRIKLVKAIGAFGNTDGGGFIIIGVSDDRKIVGLTDDVSSRYDQTSVLQYLSRYLAPVPILQVRHHAHQGKNLVIIEVDSFIDIPSIVSQSARAGKETITAGTILFRNAAAQSAVVTSTSDVHVLCNAIARRRAGTIAELLKGTFTEAASGIPFFDGIADLRSLADVEWPSVDGGKPYIEVAFSPEHPFELQQTDLRRLLEKAHIPIRYGFPTIKVGANEVHRATAWGWYGRIPFSALGGDETQPSYLWLLSRQGAFLDRDPLWEDEAKEPSIRRGVGMFHLFSRIILLVRFLDAFSQNLGLPEELRFRASVSVVGVRGRFLVDDRGDGRRPGTRGAVEHRVEARAAFPLRQLRDSAKSLCTTLAEELAEQFGRDDL